MENHRETKEEIKDRMIKTALDYWNVKKVENLDPLIRLLIEALAVQLHALSEDIAEVETRAMRRLSEVLLPEALTVVHPAHGILASDPLVDGYVTDLYSGFSIASPALVGKNLKTYQFSPVCRTPLRRVKVETLIIEGNVYEMTPDRDKRLVLRMNAAPETVGKVYIGLDFVNKVTDLEHLSLYLDFPNIDSRNEYLHMLNSTSWKCNGLSLDMGRGLYVEKNSVTENTLPDFFSSLGNDERVDREIMDYYKPRYVTIESPLKISVADYRKVPMVYTPALEEYSKVCLKDLLWLEVDFPSNYSSSVLSDLQVCVNAFPVANKKFNKMTDFVKKDFGVMPLEVMEGESYFDVVNVSDEFGRTYCKTYGYKENASDLTYTLRHGGCESFDKRDASELLIRMKTLLEDELSTFSSPEFAKGAENVSEIEKLLQKVSMMPAVREGRSEVPYYLFVEPPQQSTLFYVDYWTSVGAEANGLRIGQSAAPDGSLYSFLESSNLLTPTIGGKGTPTEKERIARFKYILGSRDRIVTNNDIRNFCLAELTDWIKDVRIEKGISKGCGTGQGLLRTIDVHLVPIQPITDEKQKIQMLDALYNHLVAKSPMTFNYRLFID